MSYYRPWSTPQRQQSTPMQGLGVTLAQLSPLSMATYSPAAGLGAAPGDGIAGTQVTTTGLLLVGLAAALSYYAGAAMAPAPARRNTWGLVGIPVGVLAGPIGLGIMGIVALRK